MNVPCHGIQILELELDSQQTGFCSCDLDLDPMTLIYELDLYIQKMYRITDLYIYILDAVPPIHVVSNHVDIDKLITANGGTFTSSSASLSSQSR